MNVQQHHIYLWLLPLLPVDLWSIELQVPVLSFVQELLQSAYIKVHAEHSWYKREWLTTLENPLLTKRSCLLVLFVLQVASPPLSKSVSDERIATVNNKRIADQRNSTASTWTYLVPPLREKKQTNQTQQNPSNCQRNHLTSHNRRVLQQDILHTNEWISN
jgi:hypothetical protein